MRSLSLLVTFLSFGLFFCSTAYAQSAPTIVLSPAFPSPDEGYTASVLDSTGSIRAVRWFVDGKALESNEGGKEINLTAKGLGVRQRIVADVTYADGLLSRAEKVVTPLRIDLVVSAQTLVPSFYKGRSEVSGESEGTVTALVFGGSPKGETYQYLWNVAGKNQNGGTSSSKNSVAFVSGFRSDVPVIVSVYSGQTLVGEASVVVPVVESEVHFYERNPLRGLRTLALVSPHFFIGEEMIVRAEAFFTNKKFSGEPSWRIGTKDVENNGNPYEVTLQKQGGGSKTRVFFEQRDPRALLQSIRGSLDVQF
jgi:hypothetical protein